MTITAYTAKKKLFRGERIQMTELIRSVRKNIANTAEEGCVYSRIKNSAEIRTALTGTKMFEEVQTNA